MDIVKDLRPGVVVFGRVKGFPWWPALVTCAPDTSDWVKNDGRVWCLFFNDRTGAWLKATEIRPFDAFHREECMVINRSNKGHKRFIDRIVEAISCALSYVITLPTSPEVEEPRSMLAPWAKDDDDKPPNTVAEPATAVYSTGNNLKIVGPVVVKKASCALDDSTQQPVPDKRQREPRNGSRQKSNDPSSMRAVSRHRLINPSDADQAPTVNSRKHGRPSTKLETDEAGLSLSGSEPDHGAKKVPKELDDPEASKLQRRKSAPAVCLEVSDTAGCPDQAVSDARSAMDGLANGQSNDGPRPKRKRTKSIRYDGFEGLTQVDGRRRKHRGVTDTGDRSDTLETRTPDETVVTDSAVEAAKPSGLGKFGNAVLRLSVRHDDYHEPVVSSRRETGRKTGLSEKTRPADKGPSSILLSTGNGTPLLNPQSGNGAVTSGKEPFAMKSPAMNCMPRKRSSRIAQRSLSDPIRDPYTGSGSTENEATIQHTASEPDAEQPNERDGCSTAVDFNPGAQPDTMRSTRSRESHRTSEMEVLSDIGFCKALPALKRGNVQHTVNNAETRSLVNDLGDDPGMNGACAAPASGSYPVSESLGKCKIQPLKRSRARGICMKIARPDALSSRITEIAAEPEYVPGSSTKQFAGDRTDSEDDAEASLRPLSGNPDIFEEERLDKLVVFDPQMRPLNVPRDDVRADETGDPKSFSGDVLRSLLHRVSDLEKEVKYLKGRAAAEEQAVLGEDATAAGLKAAVEAFASASAAFAKKRNFDSTVVRRALDSLWPDGAFPLAGVDGDLLHSVARSLVMASCKRGGSLP
jgi:PWWP domain